MADRLMDIPIYLAVAGMIQGVMSLVALLLFLLVCGGLSRRFVYVATHVFVFNVILLGVGCAANSVWMTTVYHRWYVSADTMVDFFPFIPFGQWVLDQEFGEFRGRLLNGPSVAQLRYVWLALSAATWVLSAMIYRRLRGQLPQPVVHPTAA